MVNWLKGNGIRANILLCLTTFVVFLLVFERALVVPLWLQPLGRMHPMFVHFPIVLVLLAMGLDFFLRRPSADDSKQFYAVFSRDLLFASAVLSGFTVIMGIFLSKEEGYASEPFLWHKWSGVLVFLLVSAFSSFRDSSWFASTVARACALVATLCVVVAGHSGGTLTHGEDFILQPVRSIVQVSNVEVSEALAFEHVIKPVFDAKCKSCHNPLKRKGELSLTDSSSVRAGGETGELLVAGDPDASLLLQRITLPLDDKEHMPPSDKPQLTADEKDLLYRWVKSGATFGTRVMALPETDSFRLAAVRVLEARRNEREQFDFPAADPETLTRLNSNYRVIRPVSKNSPALAVNVYNAASYSPTTLNELDAVRRQVIALDLNKMPVRDEDLAQVARMGNLRKLFLNFTRITGAGLAPLRSLSKLEHLSVAGTSVQYNELVDLLPHFQQLKHLAVWQTQLSTDEIVALQEKFPQIEISGAAGADLALIRLNPPRLNNKKHVFDDSLLVELFHPVQGAEIRYTMDGSDPDSVSSAVFTEKIPIGKTTAIKARAFKNGWLSSDVATLNVYGSRHKPDTAILLSLLNRVHVARGAYTFFDHELGTFNANSPAWANNWGGVRGNDLELLLMYDMPVSVSSISLNCLIETENVIFPPESIEVWGGPSADALRRIASTNISLPTEYKKPYITLLDCGFEAEEIACLKIIARPVKKLPEWHKAKGRPGLLLIDEILVN